MVKLRTLFIIKYFLLFALILVFIGVKNENLFFIFAQEQECKTREECEALLRQYEEEIKKLEGVITKTRQEKRTLQNQISILRSKIQRLDLQIQQGNIMIRDLGIQIEDTEYSIEKTLQKIEETKEKLAKILRSIYEESEKSHLEILLVKETLSAFFDNLMALENLHQQNQEILGEIKLLKSTLEEQKDKLSQEKDALAQTVKVRVLQKQQSDKTREEQKRILRMTETQYQQYFREKQELEKRAAEIVARIVQLTLPGLEVPRDRKELYSLANWAGTSAGGVRPALILGLIEVESALGANVGQCNCAGRPVCRHPELTYKQVMRRNQWAAFEAVTRELGLNPNTTPVSCFVAGGKVQMGGAMGPSQFMPNTWLNLGYKQRVEQITMVRPANPWLARDAFLASALYLADWNAQTRIRANEIGAVTAYLCGTNVMTPVCKQAKGEWYRNLVMEKANQWQAWIDRGI